MSWSRASWKLGVAVLMLLISLAVSVSPGLTSARELPSPGQGHYDYDASAGATIAVAFSRVGALFGADEPRHVLRPTASEATVAARAAPAIVRGGR